MTMNVYLVGGAVRDQLLGRPVLERDWVVVGATGEEMLSQGFKAVGKDFPVYLHPETKEEYALARIERKKGHGYHGFEIHAAPEVTLEEDLLRRDLTINAMAQDNQGNIIDPYGGQADLKNKILRHVSDAFSEDPLRVLRVARFAAKYHAVNFTVAHETMSLMKDIVASRELTTISRERVWQETSKAMLTDSPAVYFEVLYKVNALQQILPHIDKLFSSQRNHRLGLAVLNIIKQRYEEPEIRFVAFLSGLTYYHDDLSLVNTFCHVFPLPNKSKNLLTLIVTCQHQCHKALQLTANELLKLLYRLDYRRNPIRFIVLLDICQAIYTSIETNTLYKQKQFLQVAAKEIEKIDIENLTQSAKDTEQISSVIQQAQLQQLENLLQHYK